jgi:hypothetical protein
MWLTARHVCCLLCLLLPFVFGVCRVLPDLMGRTMQFVNDKEELVCFVQKTTKAMIMEVKGEGMQT